MLLGGAERACDPAAQVARRMGQPRVDLPAPASEAADLGEHEAVRSEGPLGGERRRLWFGEHVHDLDDGDHGDVNELRRGLTCARSRSQCRGSMKDVALIGALRHGR